MGRVSSLFAYKVVTAAGPAADRDALLGDLGLDPAAAPDVAETIPAAAYYALFETLAAADHGPVPLPLRAGASMRCEDYGLFGMAWKAAPSLRGSFERAVRYWRLLTDVAAYTLRQEGRDTALLLQRDGPWRGLQLSNEATLASVVAICSEVATVPFRPRAVWFRHPPLTAPAAHEAYFGCPVTFSADRCGFLLDSAAIARPNRLGDAAMTRFFDRLLDRESDRLRTDPPIEDHVCARISRALSAGKPRMAEIAQSLAMSERTLQRRLAARGKSFQRLVEHSRQQMARQLLEESRHSLAEIAFMTGFSEQSAFSRAFKRWTGQSPALYRAARPA